jgi:hypothetical protein|tara:strand:+ start:38 stop:181 length:144 start_codon:yes stop_codon:yes gene_type:complete
MPMILSRNQIDLILYSLEQQQIEFNDIELKDLEIITNELSIYRELAL